MFFINNDEGQSQKWRLKGHARDEFWRWMAQWSVMIQRPSDLGFNDDGYNLPPLNYHHVVTDGKPLEGFLFPMEAKTMPERQQARRESIGDRVGACADKITEIQSRHPSKWLVWCNLNNEQDALEKALKEKGISFVSIKGSTLQDQRDAMLEQWQSGGKDVLITKPSVYGFGLNFQFCHYMAFLGLSDSFESMYQAVRRCWRYGQVHPVDVHIITSETEGAVVKNIQRKESDFYKMSDAMVKHMKDLSIREVTQLSRQSDGYKPTSKMILPQFMEMENGSH